MSILVLGTVALDTVKTPHGLRRDILGGSAAHFSMAARLFTDVHLVAVVGEDFPIAHIEFLRKKGVELTSLIREKGPSFKWSGKYEGDLNSAITLSTELGVLASFKPRVGDHQRGIANIFLANIDPDIQRHLLNHMHKPKLVGLDSMNYWINTKRKALLRVLKMVNIYLVNDAEARQLSGEHSLIKAAKAIRKMGPEIVVLKKGEHGVLLYCDKFIFSLPAFPVMKVVDPTGAGDTFAGGFMGYLSRAGNTKESELRKAIAYGVAAASYNVEDFGLNRTSKLKYNDLVIRLKSLRKVINF